MSRFARERRVFYVEEPLFDTAEPALSSSICPKSGVCVLTPHLRSSEDRMLEALLLDLMRREGIEDPIAWFYTPMALQFFPAAVKASVVVYDCMDELSMFRGAPRELASLEASLMRMADLVFTGGVSLFEAKRHLHPRVHPFPSGVDGNHFLQARSYSGDFQELAQIQRPRIGYAGVIDERLDLELIDNVARLRPEWQLIMIGPVVKISTDSLPQRTNIHWLGMKDYADLPKYFAGWDAAMMPFALNDATRFISPTKTPEYLAAGLPVISTPIRDVVRPYGKLGLVRIAATAEEFIIEAESAMNTDMCLKWRERADEFLRGLTWDSVWAGMNRHILSSLKRPSPIVTSTTPAVEEMSRV